MTIPDTQNNWPLNTLYFYLTEGCNLACRHCWIAPKFEDEKHHYAVLPVELFKKIISEAKPLGLSSVKLTGGEPLMHPQIADLLVYIQKQQLGLTIETNGVLCTPALAKQIAGCSNPFVSVSLDGVDAATHEWVRGVKGCFNQAVEGVKNLVAVGFKPQIIMSLMRCNKDQIEPMIRLAEELGAGSVKFNLIQPTERGERLYEADQGLRIEEYIELGNLVEKKLALNSKIRLFYDHPMAFRPLSHLFGNTGNGCGRCGIMGILGVLADGSYALCGIGASLPELVFGNAAKDDLLKVWTESRVLNQLRSDLPSQLKDVCAECMMKNLCLGSCVAQNYYRTKDLMAGFWFCEQANNHDLFPPSRRIKKDIV